MRPGWQTTEFWLSLGMLVATGLFGALFFAGSAPVPVESIGKAGVLLAAILCKAGVLLAAILCTASMIEIYVRGRQREKSDLMDLLDPEEEDPRGQMGFHPQQQEEQ